MALDSFFLCNSFLKKLNPGSTPFLIFSMPYSKQLTIFVSVEEYTAMEDYSHFKFMSKMYRMVCQHYPTPCYIPWSFLSLALFIVSQIFFFVLKSPKLSSLPLLTHASF